MGVQIINDNDDQPAYAVIPYDEYIEMVNGDNEDDDDSLVTIPHEVVEISVYKKISVIAAWRVYRGLSQLNVCDLLGVSQPNLSRIEKVGSKPRRETRQQLADIYNCDAKQLLDC